VVADVIVKTDFQRGDAGDLLEYIQRDDKEGECVPVRDHSGRQLDEERIAAFAEQSAKHGFERHLILAPDSEAQLTTDQLDRGTRRLMSDWRADRPSVSYVYAVHPGDGKPHVHAAATGRERDLYMDREDLAALRQDATEAFREEERRVARTGRPTSTSGPGSSS
jgi:hypothetical protein